VRKFPLLPGSTWGDSALCPWCSAYTDDATVRLEALAMAFIDDSLRNPRRNDDGTADPSALVMTCDACGKPSMVALRRDRDGAVMQLIPVRTEADARLIRGEA